MMADTRSVATVATASLDALADDKTDESERVVERLETAVEAVLMAVALGASTPVLGGFSAVTQALNVTINPRSKNRIAEQFPCSCILLRTNIPQYGRRSKGAF